MKLLHFMEDRWQFRFAGKEQMEELLHVSFVKDGREIPEELSQEEDAENNGGDQSIYELRKEYWTYALPIIQKAQGGEGHPYARVKPSEMAYKDGYFGVQGVHTHLYCSIRNKLHRCVAGLWIDAGDKAKSKAVFDIFFSHKEEIEKKITLPVEWDRKEADRACSISVSIEADVINRDEWEKIARFHAEMTKQLADYAFYPYVQELKAFDSTF